MPEEEPMHATIMQEVPETVEKENQPFHALKMIFGPESFCKRQQEAIKTIHG